MGFVVRYVILVNTFVDPVLYCIREFHPDLRYVYVVDLIFVVTLFILRSKLQLRLRLCCEGGLKGNFTTPIAIQRYTNEELVHMHNYCVAIGNTRTDCTF